MREFVIVVSSSSSSISTPPNPSRHHHPRHFRSSSKFSPSNLPSRSSAVRSDLRHFVDFAGDAKLRDLSVVVESLAVSGVNASRLRSALRAELASAEKGISAVLRDGKVRSFARLLGKLDELGFPPVEIFDGWALELIRRECRRILRCEQVEELVELFEVLSGYGFSIKELVKPSDVIKICVEKRKPKMAIRYACTLPHAHIIFCDAVYEFGKKGDLVSALIAYEASKKNSTSTNMYLYRTIIDVCGRCHDYQKSRYIYEDLVNEKVTPNVYVFNSLMNVNAHDFSYTLKVYKDMQLSLQ